MHLRGDGVEDEAPGPPVSGTLVDEGLTDFKKTPQREVIDRAGRGNLTQARGVRSVSRSMNASGRPAQVHALLGVQVGVPPPSSMTRRRTPGGVAKASVPATPPGRGEFMARRGRAGRMDAGAAKALQRRRGGGLRCAHVGVVAPCQSICDFIQMSRRADTMPPARCLW